MAEVNEIVRVSVIIENAQRAAQQVELTEKSVHALRDSFQLAAREGKNLGTNIVEGVELVAKKLQENLINPTKRAALTLLEVRNAQQELNQQFERAHLPQQRQRIAQLRREYDALEEEIVQAAGAQDVFRTKLGGFGAQGSAGAASLIQLTRGVEDLRFGIFAAINNIEPFISSLQRLSRIAAATGVSVRTQLIGALTGPAGLLFIFQAILTVSAILGPLIAKIFADADTEADRFKETLGEALDTLTEFDRKSDIVFKISTDQTDLERQLEIVERARKTAKDNIERTAVLAVGRTALVARQVFGQIQLVAERLTDEEKAQRDTEKDRLELLDQLKEKIQGELELTKALTRAEEELRNLGIGIPEDPDAENRAKEIARLRERLARELADARKDIIEDEVEREIAGVEEVFRRRFDLAEELGDTDAIEELETALVTRIFQIRKEAAEKAREEEVKEAERIAKLRERLEREIGEGRIATIDDEFEQRIAKEEEVFRRRIELARQLQDETAVLTLEAQLEARRFDIFKEFQEKRIAEAAKTNEKIARLQERIAREQQRIFEQIFRETQRFTDQFIFTLLDAARQKPGLTQEEIELQKDLFDEQELELRRSLERRLLTQQEFSLRLREINQERADFERKIEKDNIGFAKQVAIDLGDFLIEESARRLSAFIAQQIAQRIFAQTQLAAATATTTAAMAQIAAVAGPAAAATSIATFGGAAAAGTAAATASILSIQALITSLQASARGFREGGFTGNFARNMPAGIVHGGEHVFEEPLVSRDRSAFRALHGFLRGGGDLRDILSFYGIRGFQLGGPVPIAQPSSTFRPKTLTSPRDLDIINRQFDIMNSNIARMRVAVEELASRPVVVQVDNRSSRNLTQSARVEESDITPRSLKA